MILSNYEKHQDHSNNYWILSNDPFNPFNDVREEHKKKP